MKGIEYRGVMSVDGPIVAVKRTENVFYNETVCRFSATLRELIFLYRHLNF